MALHSELNAQGYDGGYLIQKSRVSPRRLRRQPARDHRMLDFALKVGFEIRLCCHHHARTNGKVESGVRYVKGNMLPGHGLHPCDAGLNRRGLWWCDTVANARVRGTTHRVPWEMPHEERRNSGKLPGQGVLAPCPREDRKLARDGFVS